MWETIDRSRSFHDEGYRSELLKALCNQICNNEDIKQSRDTGRLIFMWKFQKGGGSLTAHWLPKLEPAAFKCRHVNSGSGFWCPSVYSFDSSHTTFGRTLHASWASYPLDPYIAFPPKLSTFIACRFASGWFTFCLWTFQDSRFSGVGHLSRLLLLNCPSHTVHLNQAIGDHHWQPP